MEDEENEEGGPFSDVYVPSSEVVDSGSLEVDVVSGAASVVDSTGSSLLDVSSGSADEEVGTSVVDSGSSSVVDDDGGISTDRKSVV